jgi:hypothetical protein
MAKKKAGKSGSQHIREYLAKNPTATPNQIIEALANKGVKVSSGLVSNVKYTSGPTVKGKKKAAPKNAVQKWAPKKKAAPKRGAAALTVEDLLEAKKLADELGGIAEARKALDTLEKLK